MSKLSNPISEEEVLNQETQNLPSLKRDVKGRLLPGQRSLNPGGRTRDIRTAQGKLWKALKKVEKQKGLNFLENYIERALDDKTMAIALLRKIVPDLKAVEIDAQTKEEWNIILQNFVGQKE